MTVIRNDTLLYTGEPNANDVRLRDGTVSGSISATVNATGVAYVYAIGSTAVTADANDAATAVSIAYAVNSVAAHGDANDSAIGVSIVDAVNSAAVSGDANETASGVSYIYAVNDVTVTTGAGVDATVNATGVAISYAVGAVSVQTAVEVAVRIGKRQRWLKFHRIHPAEALAHGTAVRYGLSSITQVDVERNAAPIAGIGQWVVVSGSALRSGAGRCAVRTECDVRALGTRARLRAGKVSPSCDSVLLAHGGGSHVASHAAAVTGGARARFVPVSLVSGSGVAHPRTVRNPTDEQLAMIIAASRRRRAQGTRRIPWP